MVHGRDENDVVVGIQHRQYDDGRFIAAANPELVAALLDLLEAAQSVARVSGDLDTSVKWETVAALEDLAAKVRAAEKLLS